MKSGHPWPSGLAMEPSSGLLQARSSLLAFYAVFGLYGLSPTPFSPTPLFPTPLFPTPIYSPHLYPPHRYPPLSPFIPDVSDRCDAHDRPL